MNVSNDVVLITGAAQGCGAAHARAFISAGARVILADVRDAAGATLARDLGDRARYIHLDVSQERDWIAAIAYAENEFGTITVLINYAGVVYDSPLEDYDVDAWQRVIGVQPHWHFSRDQTRCGRNEGS